MVGWHGFLCELGHTKQPSRRVMITSSSVLLNIRSPVMLSRFVCRHLGDGLRLDKISLVLMRAHLLAVDTIALASAVRSICLLLAAYLPLVSFRCHSPLAWPAVIVSSRCRKCLGLLLFQRFSLSLPSSM